MSNALYVLQIIHRELLHVILEILIGSHIKFVCLNAQLLHLMFRSITSGAAIGFSADQNQGLQLVYLLGHSFGS